VSRRDIMCPRRELGSVTSARAARGHLSLGKIDVEGLPEEPEFLDTGFREGMAVIYARALRAKIVTR
jgi:hypothetical protein